MCCYMLYIINNQRYNQNNQHIISITGFETLFELFSRNGGRNGLCVTRKELAADKNWENSVKYDRPRSSDSRLEVECWA